LQYLVADPSETLLFASDLTVIAQTPKRSTPVSVTLMQYAFDDSAKIFLRQFLSYRDLLARPISQRIDHEALMLFR
jgi:hypothetical protein